MSVALIALLRADVVEYLQPYTFNPDWDPPLTALSSGTEEAVNEFALLVEMVNVSPPNWI
jgi:hypothetical protein